jgi:hypothetical protein
MTTAETVARILDERMRQDLLYPHQPDVLSKMEWASVLAQEGNELIEQLAGAIKRVQQAAANQQGYRLRPPDDLTTEAIQTAATALRVIAFTDRLVQHPAAAIFEAIA